MPIYRNQTKNKTLAIIIPVYNEDRTIDQILKRVLIQKTPGWKKKIIVVDDGSTDQTTKILKKFSKKVQKKVEILTHTENRGKGASIKTGLKLLESKLKKATLNSPIDAILIQDADLEYSPLEYPKLLEGLSSSEVVYGSRNLVIRKKGYPHYFWGGRFLSGLVSFLYQTKLTDINTCYKLFRTETLLNLKFKANGFDFCEEVTCHLLNKGIKIKEVPISYNPRTFQQGKKLKLKDGLKGLIRICLLRFDGH